jgi:hypothetical protein
MFVVDVYGGCLWWMPRCSLVTKSNSCTKILSLVYFSPPRFCAFSRFVSMVVVCRCPSLEWIVSYEMVLVKSHVVEGSQ